MNPEDETDGEIIGQMLWEPKDPRELRGIIELAGIGFNPRTDEGRKAMLRCLVRNFIKMPRPR